MSTFTVEPIQPNTLGLYVHFPWCVKKCPYCDFNSHPLRGALDERRYIDALLADFAQYSAAAPIASIYCGGGTPSLFPPAAFHRLLRGIDYADDIEITMEANPGTLERSDFRAYRDAGINRISLGAQSFDDAQLVKLGRVHRAAETLDAVERIHASGMANFNIDIMYGLPGQSVAGALADLDTAIDLAPTHLSWYQLTIEPKTEFARRIPTAMPDEARVIEIEAAGLERLAAAGYDRYEVSAFARDGAVSRHNVNYWSFGDYLGIGAGAHGKLTTPAGIVRTTKASQPRLYLDSQGEERRAVSREELTVEFMMNALRLVDGVVWEDFSARTGLALDEVRERCDELMEWGLLRTDRLALTQEGFRHLDAIVARFL